MHFKTLVFSILTVFSFCAGANAWEVHLPETALDNSLILVDKGKDEFFYLEKHGSEITRLHYPSIHGEKEGDKLVQGDLKTPEGVYFVRGKIQVPLDFEMYGDHAYPLNYPNPIDILRGKTGGGIWIHSKGNPIEGQVTQGCVAIDLADIKALDKYLQAGTPVVIAQGIRSSFHKDKELERKQTQTTANTPAKEHDEAPLLSEAEAEKLAQSGNLGANALEVMEEKEQDFTQMLSSFISADPAEKNAQNGEQAQTARNEEMQAADTAGGQDAEAQEAAAQEMPAALQNHAEQEEAVYADNSKDADFIRQATYDWNNAWADRSEEFFDFYDTEKYSRTSGSFAKFKANKESLFSTLSWIYIAVDDVEVLEGPDYFVSWFKQYYVAPNHKTEGIRRLYWMKDDTGTYKVCAMEWLPRAVKLEHTLTDKIKKDAPAFIEKWRLAWEQADINAYAAFYSDYAIQDTRRGLDQIIAQKQDLWSMKKPTKVKFSDMTMSMEKEGLVVRMVQDYEDNKGYRDRGMKIMTLIPKGSSWIIAKEWWRRL